jgi:hypothetical protein
MIAAVNMYDSLMEAPMDSGPEHDECKPDVGQNKSTFLNSTTGKILAAGLAVIGIAGIVGRIYGHGCCNRAPAIRPQPAEAALTKPFLRFTSTDELYKAVDDYLNVTNGKVANTTQAAITYGYPIGTWDVSHITDFTRLFDSDRHIDIWSYGCSSRYTSTLSTFNEDLNEWDKREKRSF